ncbi:MAG TPA: methyltransferase domain-containing protein [Terriglobales bacterium]|nr:methyltransferase domain-containing protein [Terriglobales bacterium]
MTSWYETFFSGLSVEFWVQAAPPPSPEELNFLREQFAIQPGQKVLDIPCGAGRHAVPLAELGYSVTGFDISTQFLSESRRLAQARGVSVDWRLGDMRTLAFEREFDAALCFGNSFGYLSRADTKQFLKRLAAALRDGARFVLESGAVAESILPNLVRSRWMQVGDILFLTSVDYDARTSRLISRYLLIRGSEREEKTAEVMVYTLGELRELFADAGFIVEGLFASTAKEPFEVGAPRLLLVARKTAAP